MKILQVIPYFYPAEAYGGPVSVAYNVSLELVRRGHEVTVYTTDTIDRNNRQRPKNLEIEGVKVRYFCNLSNNLAWRRLSISPGMIFQLQKEIKSFDIIHSQDFRTFQNLIVHYFATKHNVPYIIQAHGSAATLFHRGKLKAMFDYFWGRRILKDASNLIATTRTEAQQYLSFGINRDKINIVPNAIDPLAFHDLPTRGSFRKKYHLTDNTRIILFLGRINKIKGLELLVSAFANISNDLGKAELVIAGPDDGYLPRLKDLIKSFQIQDKVLFTGPLYGNDKHAAYIDADVYVLPSVFETFPITILESCACGLPVVVTEQCGITDIVHEQVGLAVPRDSNQLGQAILKILMDGDIRHRFSKRGKELVTEEFLWSKIAIKLEGIYKDILIEPKNSLDGN